MKHHNRLSLDTNVELFVRMSSFRFVLVSVLVTLPVAFAEDPVRYDGHHLLRTIPQNDYHVERLAALHNDPQVDFWIAPRAVRQPVDMFVSPERISSLKSFVNEMGLKSQVLMNDAQKLLEENQMASSKNASGFDWENYHTIDAINAWLREQAEIFRDVATVITAGKSSEGRDLTGLRIAHKPNQSIVFIEAGIHAREWIAPATATWFIQQALNTTDDLLKSYEWHVFPSINPDGYAYTQTNRMWRKTRSRQTQACFGVDANRNWPYKWHGFRSVTACSNNYPGPSAASEPETKGLMNYLQSVANRTLVHISLHSYKQLLMYPWGYTTARPTNDKRLYKIARKAVKKLFARFGTTYKFGPIAGTIYQAYGTTTDYAYSLNITYPFVFELRDDGKYGHLLPKEQIIPTATETFDAIKVILREAKK